MTYSSLTGSVFIGRQVRCGVLGCQKFHVHDRSVLVLSFYRYQRKTLSCIGAVALLCVLAQQGELSPFFGLCGRFHLQAVMPLRCFLDIDEKLYATLSAVKQGDDVAFSRLCEDYRALVKKMVRSFSKTIPDVDPDDLEQEALCALSEAARRYDLGIANKVTFGLYAKVCIKNKMISMRRKFVARSNINPVKEVGTAGERKSELLTSALGEDAKKLLSRYEYKVLTLYISESSYTYKEIARRLGRSEKSVDNAVYRIKRKLKDKYSII